MKIPSLQILAENLVERGLVFETRGIRSSRVGREEIIEIGDTGPLSGDPIPENSVNFYLEVIKQSKFSWMLFDASLIQIWYRRRADSVVAHRFCYLPAPFDVDLRAENGVSNLGEIIEGGSAIDPLNQMRKTILRFECDFESQTEFHPAAHLHLNSSECRIPMRAALNVKDFMYFLMRFFYAQQFDVSSMQPNFTGPSTLSQDEERSFHINWRIV